MNKDLEDILEVSSAGKQREADVCPNCGRRNEIGGRYCLNCGAELTVAATSHIPPQVTRDITSPRWIIA